MTRRMAFKWQKLFLMLTVLHCCWSLQVSIPNKEYKVAKGKEVTIICSFVPAISVTDSFFLSWEANPEVAGKPMNTVATYFINKPVAISPSYEGRAFLEVDIAGGTSKLRLTKLTMKDSRHYQCSVRIFGDDEGTPADSTSLLVLEPPSPPVCTLQGRAEYFHNVTLICESVEGSPKPTYQWTTYSVENVPRQFPPKATQKDGVLSLFNISRETSGFFVCVSKNEIDSASCNFTLAVMPASMNLGSTAGIIGGVLAGVVVLGIIFCCCRNRRKKNKHYEGSAGDMEFYDKEPGDQYSDDKSNNEEKQVKQDEDEDVLQNKNRLPGMGRKLDDDQHSYNSGKNRHEERSSNLDSQPYQEDQQNHYKGSQDHLDDRNDHYESRNRLDNQRNHHGSRDRLDDQRDHYGSRDQLDDQRNRHGSRDWLDDQRNHHGSRDQLDEQCDRYGSRDQLDDQRNRHGSRDRLDDQRDYYGSRDRLNDQRNRHGSRDQLDDQRDHYGSRDWLNDQRNRYGSRDRLDDQRDCHGSRDRLDDQRDRHGSRDRLDDQRDRYGSRDRLDEQQDRYGSRDRLDEQRDRN